MSVPSLSSSTCCEPCGAVQTVQVPGTPGAAGADGADGSDGVNAYTYTTAQFIMPAGGATVSVSVTSASWMVPGQMLAVQSAGTMQVSSVTNATTVVLYNPELAGAYAPNAAAGAAIPSGSKVAPSGVQGVDGDTAYTTGGDIELDAGNNPRVAITSAIGDLMVNTGIAVPPRNTAFPAGTNLHLLHVDTATATHLRWHALDLNGTTTAFLAGSILPVAYGGTGGNTGATARTALTAAASGANADITSITGLTTPLTVAQGGTGVASIPLFRAHRNNADQASVASNAAVLLGFTNEDYDPTADFAVATSAIVAAPSRFTPDKAGVYHFNLSAMVLSLAATRYVTVLLYKNGAEYARGGEVYNHSAGTQDTQSQLSVTAQANGTTDYFEGYIYYSDAGAVTKTVEGDTNRTFFEAFRVGPAA